MKKLISILLTAGVFISSCNIPLTGNTDPAISTSAALTVQAAVNTNPLASATAPASASAEITPTFSEPVIAVDDVTNCRSGPGTNFERITQITPGEQIKIIGVFESNYWIVSTSAGVCWVSAEFATPMGSVQAVPTVTAPATPTGNAPEGVSLQKWDIFCNFQTNQADVTIKWSDEDNEAGYRVIRNGNVIAELPENTTQFSETISLLSGQSVGYAVEAFNGIGTSSSKTIALYC
jgi:uncharacterized protein YraI